VKTLQGEGWPSAVAQEALEAGPVRGFDPDAGVEAKTTAVVPCEHVLGDMGLQQAVAAKVAQHPGADDMLEPLQELGGEAKLSCSKRPSTTQRWK